MQLVVLGGFERIATKRLSGTFMCKSIIVYKFLELMRKMLVALVSFEVVQEIAEKPIFSDQ